MVLDFKSHIDSDKNLKKINNHICKLEIDSFLVGGYVRDLLLSKEDVKNSKPDPEIYLMASSMLKVEPEECLVFEDSKPGKEAAKNANMDVIIVPEDVASSIIDIDK